MEAEAVGCVLDGGGLGVVSGNDAERFLKIKCEHMISRFSIVASHHGEYVETRGRNARWDMAKKERVYCTNADEGRVCRTRQLFPIQIAVKRPILCADYGLGL